MAMIKKASKGATLIELIAAMVIFGVVLFGFVRLAHMLHQTLQYTQAKQDMLRESQTGIETTSKLLRLADGSTVVISADGDGRPFGRIQFKMENDPRIFQIYQSNNELTLKTVNGGVTQTRRLASYLSRVCFVFPRYPVDLEVLQISLSFSKNKSDDQAIIMSNTVKLLNPGQRNLDRGI